MPKQVALKSQIEKFRELAREIETVDSEEPLNAAIRKVGKSPPPPKRRQGEKGNRGELGVSVDVKNGWSA